MANEVTRYISKEVERELWARAAGRCQFRGCNQLLYKSPVTQESVHIAEKAHIYSFSKNGPRGWGPFITNRKALNNLPNLLLTCHSCHRTIDQDKQGERYSAELLASWKDEHEKRIAIVTGIDPDRRTHVILYGANIGHETSRLQPEAAKEALFPDAYPSEEHPIKLSMDWEGKDRDASFWTTEAENLRVAFERLVRPVLNDRNALPLAVFAFGPMPLLTLLGSLLTDKPNVSVYQLHREPHQTWKWLDAPNEIEFEIAKPADVSHPPALVISLSDSIAHDRVISVLGEQCSIWELSIRQPHNDFLKSRRHLSAFRETLRRLVVEIGKVHGKHAPLSIFPTMPVACAVELGRIRMPKADSPWVLYDQHNAHRRFIHALTIGESNE